jgi:uncharacterized protein
MPDLQGKHEALKDILQEMGSALIAFSGGVDSTLLLKVAYDLLGEKSCGITATSPTYPDSEFLESVRLAELIGARQLVVESNELEIPGYSANPRDRCYHCKKELFHICSAKAAELGFEYICDGTNCDDLGDYRPGRRAAGEHNVRSPLLEAGFSKYDVRQLSRLLGLPTWDKQAYACLASRFPYGVEITADRLRMVESCEEFLKAAGFNTYRVRYHGDTARIELGQDEIARLIDGKLRDNVVEEFKRAGFKYVALDLDGYRTGSMNL